ncbi:hypothetical protein NHH03_06955 [Stieleria sp. TO1_6]|uniref:hypothetical protein n=1 Tax=Stieleria tagensis TaxID=2956795 RepID=UPI00209A7A6F|nr:hypothetical protein [Stieleria tagensis]MCO8121469.1 hypothetical protein [Stieleria tagensis]
MARRRPRKPSSSPVPAGSNADSIAGRTAGRETSGESDVGRAGGIQAGGSDTGGNEVGGSEVGGSEVGGSDPADVNGQTRGFPPPWLVGCISLALVFHLGALFLSYSAIIEPSSTHTRLLNKLTPYLRATHFSADGRPFYLAHATADEQPHRLQVATGLSSSDSNPVVIDLETQWTTVQPGGIPGLAAADRYRRWMLLVATLAQSDRPSLAAALLMPLVAADESIDAVRIVRLPTELTTAEDDAAPPVYLARVVREGDQVRLVSIQSKRLTTFPRENAPRPSSDEAQR